ncbi:hypothetical protein DFH27DRAFT_522102 [Peziza echinospora]|nr:hypothetical protein DFH27DRAFT_522102 [Peziza echinospora]
MSPAGFKNIRAMFEQGNQQPSSGPSTPIREISPKPLGRVRTSFVAVTGSGAMVGLQKLSSPTSTAGPEISIAEGAKLAGQVVEPDRIVPQSDEKEEEKPAVKAVVVSPPASVKKEPAAKKPEPASPPKFKINATPAEQAVPAPAQAPAEQVEAEQPAAEKPVPEKAAIDKSTKEKAVVEKAPTKAPKAQATKEKPKVSAPISKPTEKKPVTASKPPITKTTSTKPPAITKTSASSSSASATTAKPASKGLTVATATTRKATTPIPSPRLAPAKTTTAAKPSSSTAGTTSSTSTKPREKTAGPVKSVRSATATGPRSATATGLRSKTPTVSDHPLVPRKPTVPAASRLYAPTAASAARLGDEKEKAKTIATSTARRPASVAAHRPKSSLGTSRPTDKRAATAASSRATGPAKGAAAATAPKKVVAKPVAPPPPPPPPAEEAPPVPTLPTEEFLEMITRPTTASASKIVSKEELKEIGSRSTSRMSSNQGRSSRRVSVGSNPGGSTHDGSPVSRRRKMSHSPPRLNLSPEGEDAPVIEETEEEIESTPVETSEKPTKPSALELLPGDKVEAMDVHTPGSESTLVHEDDVQEEAEEVKGDAVEQHEEQVIAA